MAAPTLTGISKSHTDTANGTTRTITAPAGLTTGNMINVFAGCDGNTMLAASGWTRIIQQSQGGTVKGVCFQKEVTGSDDITITSTASEQVSAIILETTQATPAVAGAANANGTNGDPPSINFPVTGDYLVFAVYVSDDQNVATVAPTGYSGLTTQLANGAAGASVSVATKSVTSASSENPGAFTSATEQHSVFTFAIAVKGTYYAAFLDSATGSDDSSSGTLTWSNPTNLGTADDTYATTTMSGTGTSHYLKAVGFGASIPAEASIVGVKAVIKKLRNGGTTGAIRDTSVKLYKAGTITGNSQHDTGLPAWLTTDETWEYGGANSLWGVSLYPSDINDSNFGFGLQVSGSTAGTDRVANVDHYRMIIYYTLPASNSGGMSTFYDDFDDNSTDTGKWTSTNIGSGTIAETGGKLVVTFPSSPATGGGSYVGKNNYTLVSNAAFVKLDSKPASGGDEATLKLTRDGSSYLSIGYDGTTDKIVCAKGVTTTGFSNVYNIAYNSTNHKWLRIREASGTIYWDASADGITWSNLYSETAPFTVTNLTVTLIAQDFVPVSGGATWDYFNVSPATATPLRRMMGYG